MRGAGPLGRGLGIVTPVLGLSFGWVSVRKGAMSGTKRLEGMAKRLPTPLARLAKRVAVWPRARVQAKRCRAGWREHSEAYEQHVLFIAGLPKSGTTWLERMVSSYPGFGEYLMPEVAAHELRTGGSHDYELPSGMFDRFKRMLVLSKMHVHGSVNNCRVLGEAGVRYVVLYRDLRDVAVSNFFYVRDTPWHPEHPHYKGKSVEEGLLVFAERTLEAYADWVRSWHANRDHELSLVVRYEQILEDPAGWMTRVAAHFGLDDSPEMIGRIVEASSMDKMRQSKGSFVRKGKAGDWRNHFTDRVTEAFRSRIGAFLIEFGYETDDHW